MRNGTEKQLTVKMLEVYGNDTIQEVSVGTKVGVIFKECINKEELVGAKNISK